MLFLEYPKKIAEQQAWQKRNSSTGQATRSVWRALLWCWESSGGIHGTALCTAAQIDIEDQEGRDMQQCELSKSLLALHVAFALSLGLSIGFVSFLSTRRADI